MQIEMMSGNDWTGQDVSGWFASEKLRGWRLLWTGKEYVLRGGGILDVPDCWLRGMPPIALDGELYAGRHPNEGRVKSAVANGRWDELSFHPFDVPVVGLSVEAAQKQLSAIKLPDHCHIVKFTRIKSTRAALEMMQGIVAAGGEGAMLRRPHSVYVPYRTDDLLKMKP